MFNLEGDEDKLYEFLALKVDCMDLLDLWCELGGLLSPDESGIADHILQDHNVEFVWKVLIGRYHLVDKLVSKFPGEREEARQLAEDMGLVIKEGGGLLGK